MSQPLSNTLGIKRGLERDKPDRDFVLPTQEEPDPDSRVRDIIALVFIVLGLSAILTGVCALFGVWVATIVFGAACVIWGGVLSLL